MNEQPEQEKITEWARQYNNNPTANTDDIIIKEVDEYIKTLNLENPAEEHKRIITEILRERKQQNQTQTEQQTPQIPQTSPPLQSTYTLIEPTKPIESPKSEEPKSLSELKKSQSSTIRETVQKNIDADKDKITILDLFYPGEITETSSAYKMECPDCGLQGGRTEGFILFPESNTAYCHSSGKWFKMLEAYALKKKIIRCLDGREKGDNTSKILAGELFTLTLEEFKNEFGTEAYNKLSGQLDIKKSVEIPGNNRLVSDFADELGDIYKSRNVLFFRGESKDVVEIGRYKKINQEGKEYVESGFRVVSGNRFITLAEMFIQPWTIVFTKNGGQIEVDRSMSQSMANITLASPNLQNKLPIITRIFDIQIPIIYEKKLTFPKKGYDKRFGSWLPYNAPQIKEDFFTLEEAKKLIEKIFEEFCFATPKDKTHAIAGFITPFLRGLFPKFSTRTPVFIYMANRERAGKDYCAGCSGILYEGSRTEEPAISNDEKGGNSNEEIRKKIMACLIQGKKRFHSANNKGLLNNASFEGITTAEVWSDRILGRSEIVIFNNEMDFSLSGNIGIRLTPDLANRGRIINLHLVDEDANSREFKNPRLHEWILENRSSIISALYTLVKNWVSKGMPKGSFPFTSFPFWAEICGGIMEAAGYDNPCRADKTAIISLDNETEEMKQLYELCYNKYSNQWITKKDIQTAVEGEGLMNYLDLNAKSDQIKFGLKVDKFINRILSGILMTVDSLEQRSSRRKFMFTNNLGVITGVNNFCKNVEKVEKISSTGNEGGNVGNDTSMPISTKVDKTLITFDKKVEKSGNVGEVGNVSPSVPIILTSVIQPEMATLPKLPTLPNLEVPVEMEVPTKKLETLEDFSNKFKDLLKKEAAEKTHKIKQKSDRELQFYESPETRDIVVQCTKEQVLEWVRNNPAGSFERLYDALGNGCFKFVNDLINEGLIKAAGEGWEIVPSNSILNEPFQAPEAPGLQNSSKSAEKGAEV